MMAEEGCGYKAAAKAHGCDADRLRELKRGASKPRARAHARAEPEVEEEPQSADSMLADRSHIEADPESFYLGEIRLLALARVEALEKRSMVAVTHLTKEIHSARKELDRVRQAQPEQGDTRTDEELVAQLHDLVEDLPTQLRAEVLKLVR